MFPKKTNARISSVAILVLCFLALGCGQTGDLYLPEQQPTDDAQSQKSDELSESRNQENRQPVTK